MILRYMKQDGTQMEFELGERPITLGRSPDADIVVLDEKASRLHCGIRLWDGDFYIKDLKSKNGTFVNGLRVEMAKLNTGDQIRIGSFTMTFDSDAAKGQHTILREVAEELAQGKGYNTLLREIVEEVPVPAAPVRAKPLPADGGTVPQTQPTQPMKPAAKLRVRVPKKT